MTTSTASDAFSVAVRMLGRCDRSSARLRQKLQERGFSQADIDTAISRCHDYNYLNDERYATERARSLFRTGRGVGSRVLYDLRRQGIDEETARQALQTAEQEFSGEDLLKRELTRRFPDFNYPVADIRERRRVIGFLQRRGFPLDQILCQLRK